MTSSSWRRDFAAILRPASLFGRIVRQFLLITFVFAALDLGIVVIQYAGDREELAQDLLGKRAHQVEAALNASGPSSATAAIASDTTRTLFQVLAPSGQVMATNDPAGAMGPMRPPAHLITATSERRYGRYFVIDGIRRIAIGGQPAWISLRVEGSGFSPFLPVIGDEIVDHVAMPLIPLAVLTLLLNLGLVRRVLTPLRTAVAEVEALDPAEAGRRLSVPAASEEIAILVTAINKALGRMDEAMATLREFTADAAHELRTPLAILALETEQIPGDDPIVARAREKLSADIAGMTRLVSQMLDLARAQSLIVPSDAVVDLAEVARSVVTGLVPLAEARGKHIRLETITTAAVRGHAEALSRGLRNLAENALRHTPPGTEVLVSVGPGPKCVVRDHGPGIAPEIRERVFQRFHKGGSDGTGLGLSIAMAIAKAHGGNIDIDNAPDGGAAITLSLPKIDM
ncbi:hypothetical protein AEAC466_07755 [Asticcacaulis sp. AC466]|uniref:sensor histidine kinase n=1 Tax=Asticcacaulis sp. AC466 TaxID=1282362 RepID=UPI0003C4009E|nr:HAMP domain-containing sensor histidine kinase [Asticcacaulis sp. AC466]ESQ84943.1 hypothetical protein AEAC466_07755 [Asticcacaulis sp. AC466]